MANANLMKIREDFLRNQTSEKQVALVIDKIYALLKEYSIRYNSKAVKNRLIKVGVYYNVEEDVAEIINFLLTNEMLKPQDLNHFWGYVIRTLQYPPVESTKHFKQRKGKKRLDGQEWNLIMKIKRYPNIINNDKQPDWLSKSLTYNAEFAKVYTVAVMEAREMLKEVSDIEARDKTYSNLGVRQSIKDIDLSDILKEIEES